VPRAARTTGPWFGLAGLCQRPLAAADYLAITEDFAAVIVEGIPRLGSEQHDATRRFIILI
jgi:cell division protein ZapE